MYIYTKRKPQRYAGEARAAHIREPKKRVHRKAKKKRKKDSKSGRKKGEEKGEARVAGREEGDRKDIHKRVGNGECGGEVCGT